MIKKLRSLRGFSLAEMLIVCAIIAIISAISVGGILSHIKSIRQMKLDTTARTIYTAAQNRLTELYSTGDAELSKLSSDDGSTASFALNEADIYSLDGLTPVVDKPSDWGENVEFQDGILYALRSDSASEETKRLFLPKGSINEESYAKNWVIEFDPSDGYVYAVFYSDDKEPAAFYGGKYDNVHDWNNLDVIRSGRESRLKNFNATIGYYGGNITVNESYDIDELANSIRVENGEELKAYFDVAVPAKYNNSTTGIDYTVIIEGEISGNKYTYKIDNQLGGTQRRAGLLLDSLRKPDNGNVDLSFYSMFCGDNIPSSDFVKKYQDTEQDGRNGFGYSISTNAVTRTGRLIPGEDVKITFTAAIHNNNTAKQATAVLSHVSSLYASSTHANPSNKALDNNYSNVNARIACGRHLQNLDPETSHINSASNELTIDGRSVNVTIASALQTADIDLKSSAWTTAYGSRPFDPINNSQLTSYDGGTNKSTGETYKIRNMTAAEIDPAKYDSDGKLPADAAADTADAGLFGTFSGSSLKNITLVSARVHSVSGNAGALAANISGTSGTTVTIDNCQSYLLTADCDELKATADEDDTVITDKAVIYADNGNVGGLVGEAKAGIIISNSSASSVLKSAKRTSSYGGGLVGGAEKGIWIISSYADCYINAVNIGGLVGFVSGGISDPTNGEINKIIGSYSAGFAVADNNTKVSAGFGSTGTATSGAKPMYMYGSYTIFDTGSDRPNYERYSTLKTTASGETRRTENVYYTTSESDSTKAIAGTTGVRSAELKASGTDSLIEKMNTVISREAGSEAKLFNFDGGTTAYNLKANLGLTNYEYPHIGGRDHYGDWLDNDIAPGTLVYYEKYNDGTWGFYGGGISTLKNRTSSTDYVLEDGYALVYPETGADADIKADITVTVGSGSDAVSQKLTGITGTTPAGSSYSGVVPIANKGTTSWDNARFRILGNSINDYAVASGNAAGMDNFYMPVEVKPELSAAADYYYFNPHFAKTAVKVAAISDENRPSMSGTSDEKHAIYVRTPRQLYLMSRFYTVYAAASSKCVFRQELNIDYALYNWDFDADLKNSLEGNCGGETTVTVDVGNNNTVVVDQSRSQDSIGTEAHPFAAEYNGGYNTVTGFSIKTASTQHYAGLFGYVTGSLRNIAFVANYKDDNNNKLSYGINSSTQVEGIGQTAYIGMLAGCLDNGGEIDNCAAAGYVINGYAYDYSNINAGGLVGLNRGLISNSSADIPVINVHTNGGSNANIGGFVGSNANDIKDSYGIGFINAGRSASDKLGRVYLAGFAGYNTGDIEGSYCATTFISENIDTDRIGGFSQSGRGNVTRCLYLDGGSYYYIDKVRSYNVEADGDSTNHVGKAATNSDFISLLNAGISSTISMNDLSNAYGKASTSSYHQHTNTEDNIYPYPAIVEDAAGNKVHYGEWVVDSSLAKTGFVYWEKETGGSNKGYHFYILDSDNTEHSTLCTAHDDGGAITEYGYGFYYSLEAKSSSGTGTRVSATWNNVNIGASGFADAAENTDAETVLGKQFSSIYKFVLYRTTEVSDKKGTASHEREDKGMFLTDQTLNDGGNDITGGGAYAVCTLTVDNTSTEGTASAGQKQYRYVFAPFFGKSMILESVSETQGTGSPLISTDIAYPGTADGDSYDTAKKDYDRNGGTSTDVGGVIVKDYQKNGLPFEIRSAAQLQYINWRTDTYDAVTEKLYTNAMEDNQTQRNQFLDWAKSNHYKYLGWYADGINGYNTAVRPQRDASGNEVYNYYWKQTHDVNGSSRNFTPIGCLNDRKRFVDWNSGAWDKTKSIPYVSYFNGDYNGDSYKIQNINIDSAAQTVGLFGVTVCANLRNIILYSNADSVIKTNKNGENWYALGSLAGMAAQGTIENCSAAGYTIRDERGDISDGGADIGGLIGFCITDLNRCSAVNKIVLSYTHDRKEHVRVGGMVGILPGKISNSYCGGSIECNVNTGANRIHIGGFVGGEWFKGLGLGNLTAIEDFEHNADQINPVIENCYTYIKLPKKQGRIHCINVLGTTADLHKDYGKYDATPSTIVIRNCYYYNVFAGDAQITPQIAKDGTNIYDVEYQDVNGNKITGNYAAVMGLDYRTMADTVSDNGLLKLLNKGDNAFGTVTVTENGGANINGKYSFPGSDAELTGKNYPFPTVVTQADPFKPDDKTAKVNVHYGQWVKGTGIFADSTIVALDLLSQTSADDGSSVPDDEQTVNIRYYNESSLADLNTQPAISFGTGTTAAAESDKIRCTWTKVNKTYTEPAYWKLTVTGLKEGYETITLTDNTHTDPTTGRPCTTRINVSITADMTIRITPQGTITNLVAGSSVNYKLELLDRNSNTVATTVGSWRAETTDRLTAEADGITGGTATSPDILLKVNGYKAGKTQLTVTASGIASRNGGILPDKSYTMDLNVVNPTTGMSAKFYVDGDSINADDESTVILDYGQAASDDASELAKFNMITARAAADADVNGGRVFTGWATEDGTIVNADTKLYSPLTLNATWRCTEVVFCDADVHGGYVERGRLYYNNGVYYTDNTLSERAETAPLPFADKSGLVFNGYWTEAAGGERAALSDGTLVSGALSDIGSSDFVPSVKLYAHWDESYEPFNTITDNAEAAVQNNDAEGEGAVSKVTDGANSDQAEASEADDAESDDPGSLDTEADETSDDEQ